MTMLVNVAVCGRFHFHNYISVLEDENVLGRFYYSHRLKNAEFAQTTRTVNLPFKEYAVRTHLKFLENRGANVLFPLYHDIWQRGVLKKWEECDILHVMAHGNTAKIVERAKKNGSLILGEVVNTHPLHRATILAREEKYWGIPAKNYLNRQQKNICDEVRDYDQILAPSQAVKDSFVGQGISSEKISVVPYAANLSRFSINNHVIKDPKIFNVICVGQICLRKGQLRLLEAVRLLNDQSIHLTLVGKIDPQIAHLVEKYSSNFTHIERIPNAKLNEIFNRSDLFVLPSLEEGLAVVLCEALAAGVPILATKESGAAEIIESGVSGTFIESNDPVLLGRQISRLKDNRESTLEMGKVGARFAKDYQNWQRYADQLIYVYREMLETNH